MRVKFRYYSEIFTPTAFWLPGDSSNAQAPLTPPPPPPLCARDLPPPCLSASPLPPSLTATPDSSPLLHAVVGPLTASYRRHPHCRSRPLSPSPALLEPHASAVSCYRPSLPRASASAMVRTRGCHRYRPRVQTHASTGNGPGTSKAVAGYSPAQDSEAPPALTLEAVVMQSPAPAAIPEEPQGSEPPSR